MFKSAIVAGCVAVGTKALQVQAGSSSGGGQQGLIYIGGNRGYGHHHYGFCVDDFDTCYGQAMADGFEAIVDTGAKGYARMSYIESGSIPGLVCEVIEWNDLTRPYFDGMHAFLSEADDAKRVHEIDLATFVSSGTH